MRTLLTRRRVGFAALAACTAIACSDHTYSYTQSSAPEGDPAANVSLSQAVSVVTIAEGSAASAHLQAFGKDGDPITASYQITDPTVLTLATTPTDAQRYVFLGTHAGTTALTVTVNGAVVATIPVTVEAPPPFTPPGWLTGASDAGVGTPADASVVDGGETDAGDASADASDGGAPDDGGVG